MSGRRLLDSLDLTTIVIAVALVGLGVFSIASTSLFKVASPVEN